jgi:aminoglycoside/choline kinase family phosphotransferase
LEEQVKNTMSRDHDIAAFLQDAGWGNARQGVVPRDASSRRYIRLHMGDKQAVLMDAPTAAEGIACPKDATIEERRHLGYTAEARLAGTNPHAFICLTTELTRRGFSAPHIMAADTRRGLLLMEDFGEERVVETLTREPALEREIYMACMDTLAALYRSSFSADMQARGSSWHVLAYDNTALLAENQQFLTWCPRPDISQSARQDWLSLLGDSFVHLDAHAHGLALRDFHAENTFWLPKRGPAANIGLIDFQDALFAHPAYDLVSLIEDLRRDVDPALAISLIKRFMDQAGLEDMAGFNTAYNVLGVQRNAKILGFCQRMKHEQGKPQYERMMHRTRAHFTRDLSDPKLAGLKDWVVRNAPDMVDA